MRLEGDSRPADVGGHLVESHLATCGLRNFDNPISDSLNQQKTTKQPAPDMGLDGVGLSYPDNSVVAGEDDGPTAR